jgi:hypothetical protein
MTGTVDDLIESASRRGNIPDAQMTYVEKDFLALANEEILAYALPVLHSRREDYYLEEVLFNCSTPEIYIGGTGTGNKGDSAWRLPEQAMASSIREVQAMSASGGYYNIGRMNVDDVPNTVTQGWYFYGPYIALHFGNISALPAPIKIRVVYHTRPNQLITTAQNLTSGSPTIGLPVRIDSYDALNHKVYFANAMPASMSAYVDLVRGVSAYEVYKRNFIQVFSASNSVIIGPNADGTYPDIKAGDWFAVTGTTPVVPLPIEMHSLLAQRMVVKFLEAQGDQEQLGQARSSLSEMVNQIPLLISPRAEGKPRKIANRIGLWRRWRW